MLTESELYSPVYDLPREWMKKKRNRGMSWEEIAFHPVSYSILEFLKRHEEEDEWPALDAEMWQALAKNQEEWE